MSKKRIRDKDIRKKDILEAAIEVFADKGVEKSRIADIADKAGVAYGLVYHYFKNKEEILEKLFQTHFSIFLLQIEGVLNSSMTVADKLKKILVFLLSVYKANPSIIKLIIFEVSRGSRFQVPTHLERFLKLQNLIKKIFEKGIERGELSQKADPVLLSIMFTSTFEGTLTGMFMKQVEPSEKVLTGSIEVMLSGIGYK